MEIFVTECESLGLSTERLPFSNSPRVDNRAGITPPVDLPADQRFPLLARTPGDGGLLLLINGHIEACPPSHPNCGPTRLSNPRGGTEGCRAAGQPI